MIIYSKDLGDLEFVVENRPVDYSVARVTQVHGKDVVEVVSLNQHQQCVADGMYTFSGCPLSILTADCMPIAILGKSGYAMVHAGWRSLAAGILLNSQLEKISPKYFFIGPHIGGCCYRVDEAFKKNFAASNAFETRNGVIYFKLATEAQQQIEDKYSDARVEIATTCTCCHQDFYSFRRDKTDKRNWNILREKHDG